MISTPLRMEKPVRRPIVPPIRPNWASIVTFSYAVIKKLSFSLNQASSGAKYQKLLSDLQSIEISQKSYQIFRSIQSYLHIPRNLIIGCCVKEDGNCLKWCMLQRRSWKQMNIVNLNYAYSGFLLQG